MNAKPKSAINVTEITIPIIDGFAQDLKDLFTEPAKSTGMYKQVTLNTQKKKKTNTNRPWFNDACNTSKNNYKSFKKSLKGKSKDSSKDELKLLAKKNIIN